MLEWSDVQLIDGLTLRVVASEAGIRSIEFHPEGEVDGGRNDKNARISDVCAQLRAYFGGKLREFRVQLDMKGTEFQLRCWRYLETIPYGETRSYTQVAAAIGAPTAVRAVGAANGSNPVPIIVPCHRVIGASGKLVGYGGGLPLKRRLLELEGVVALPLAGL